MSFTNAVKTKKNLTRTTNGMVALKSSNSPVLDLFYNIGSFRGKDIIPTFVKAFKDNADYAVRIALWVRDIRSGSGERQVFRDILNHISKLDSGLACRIAAKVPELGRWDDLFSLEGDARQFAFNMIGNALGNDNGLCAKWMPRKGPISIELRNHFGMTPKQYRKTLVNLTNVVETQMCNKDWENINFSHVPSLASSRYKAAFAKHSQAYKDYLSKLEKGDKSVKVNAGAVYPYDVLKECFEYGNILTEAKKKHVIAQWNALPNFVGDASILPLVDVSGSMCYPVGNNKNLQAIHVSVGLGLYLADKNKGPFNGTFLTFSSFPQLMHLEGNVLDKLKQMVASEWGMSTDLHKAFEEILKTAKKGKVSQEDMPKYLLILSDMQFNECCIHDDSAIEMIRRKYEEAGYQMPKIIFWNLNATDNTPVSFNEKGVALVSGFSPSILKSILKADLEKFTPFNVMEETILSKNYDY
jgi:hypothetical protein